MLFYTHKHVSGGHSSIGKAIFAMARHSSVEWVNGQEGNTRWGGIIRKNLFQEAIVEKQCDRYSI
ncbi:hypothetical protein CRG95_09715 [Escherichia sp. E4208]|nr:hypothetical protein CRI69_18765 [Escherichia sp. E4742]TGB56038.1 hypothetical protein CRT22_14835 [Escherichia sp. E5028]TGB70297.1 hypothetical protein CQB02_00780 [Escherichia coli]TGB72958.1 hypothetical protein CRG96_00065 [Escherichia sp. E4930]TGB78763.1 hypothetical protein CRI66_07960 [Escherichia sp. E4694]TGB79920.1 hypothetical protein CRI67_01630 [Escherichia sp. E4702]TGB85127.1 hypothetical protein CRG95_09715 [Escherichia sp. E4208]TGB86192.1 hypothetical protein CRI65_09